MQILKGKALNLTFIFNVCKVWEFFFYISQI